MNLVVPTILGLDPDFLMEEDSLLTERLVDASESSESTCPQIATPENDVASVGTLVRQGWDIFTAAVTQSDSDPLLHRISYLQWVDLLDGRIVLNTCDGGYVLICKQDDSGMETYR